MYGAAARDRSLEKFVLVHRYRPATERTSMALYLFIAFLAVPVIEIGLFIELGGFLGVWPTLALVVLTAIAGTSLLRQQGGATLAKAQQNLNQGVIPLKEVFDAICLLVAGALLLTPGFLTDGLGACLLVPPFRDILRGWLGKKFGAHIQTQNNANPFQQAGAWANSPTGFDDPRPPSDETQPDGMTLRDEATDVEFTIVSEANDQPQQADETRNPDETRRND